MNQEIYSFLYTIPYLMVFVLLYFISIRERNGAISKNKSLQICVIVFVIFLCFRGFVGWDWMNYYPIFNSVDDLFHFSSSSFVLVYSRNVTSEIIEPGYIIYVSILKTIWNNWHFFVFITTLIPIFAISYIVREYSYNIALSFAIFFALYLGLLIDLMRNSLSISIFLFSLEFIRKRRLLPFLCLAFIGFNFHRTFISLFPLYFLYDCRVSSKKVWILFVVCNFIFFLQVPVVTTLAKDILPYLGDSSSATKVSSYLNKSYSAVARGLTIGYFVRIIVFLLLMSKIQIVQSKKELNFFFNAYLVYLFITLGMSDMRSFVDRLEYVYCFPFLVLYPFLDKVIALKWKSIYRIFLLSFCILKIYSYTGSFMLKYETMFDSKSFIEQYSIKRSVAEKIINAL